MALFKPFRGTHASLNAQPLHDGYAYFCTDDGSFHIDYVDADGNLHRKQINAKDAETLTGMSLDEIKEYVSVQSDFNQTDETKADYIKNKPTLGALASKDEVAKTDLAADIQASLDKADTALSQDELQGIIDTALSQKSQVQIITWGADD